MQTIVFAMNKKSINWLLNISYKLREMAYAFSPECFLAFVHNSKFFLTTTGTSARRLQLVLNPLWSALRIFWAGGGRKNTVKSMAGSQNIPGSFR